MDKARYLFPNDYMADPSANVFNGKLYIYPSHDWDSWARLSMTTVDIFRCTTTTCCPSKETIL